MLLGNASRAMPAARREAEIGNDAYRPSRAQDGAEPSVERVAAVERVGRQQVEHHEVEVGGCQHGEGNGEHGSAQVHGLAGERAEAQPEAKVHRGARERDDRARECRARQRTLEMGDAAKPRELDVGDVRAEQAAGEGVPQLVQQDGQQQAYDNNKARGHRLDGAGREVGIGEEQQHQHEQHVEVDGDAHDAADLQAREHGGVPSLLARRQLSRLRIASVRSLSALSRMNPSASVWS